MQPRKIAIANQKGGVGKTATALGLASAVSAKGGKVLVVDADSQGNATNGLGVNVEGDMLTTYHLMNQTVEGGAANAVIATDWDGVDLIPADEELGKIESDGSNDLVFRLDVAFEGLDLSPYDVVLFDCPPSLGKVLFAVLIACDGVVAVTEPTIDSVHGVERLDETIRTVRKRANPRLNFDKVVLSRRRGTAEHNFRETELREGYGDLVARTIIPELATRQDAHSARTPIHQFRGGRAISLQTAYSDLLAELSLTTGGAS
ncbi:ParA family protein (plasmid) [Rhodococcus pyridinivorans]|uniref:ParA family protein n=1 Tax=Rhodococcus TaxID=1827 RepID=UPI0020C6F278|nr:MULTISPECIES: ParA family protein [Rhodococcus]UTM39762.1 ParA family protein [Rhodococcus pyridinivorans]WKK14924.1 ParA family protein [Rhodococcus ruber]